MKQKFEVGLDKISRGFRNTRQDSLIKSIKSPNLNTCKFILTPKQICGPKLMQSLTISTYNTNRN